VLGTSDNHSFRSPVTNTLSLTSPSPQNPNLVARGIAIFRYILYRSPRWLYGCEPIAAAIIGAFAIYALVWILAVHPYYTDQCWKSGSPDLSVRAGWFSLSTTPFIYILASKKNPISFLTRIPHEKLNVYHRCIFLSLQANRFRACQNLTYHFSDSWNSILCSGVSKPYLGCGMGSK